MSVHYKFKTGLTFDKVTFDGVHISVGDLKKAIMQQKKIGKSADFDLQITNQQTKEVYDSEDVLIPKNTTVIIARVPVSGVKKHWERNEQNSSLNNSPAHVALDKIIKVRKIYIACIFMLVSCIQSSDLSNSNASEEEKIKQMMTQSTQEYDSSKFVKSRGMVGPLPPNYTCYRCGQPGHYIKHCPTNNMEIKRSTGIPRSFMIPASADQKGALLTASGEYAVPIIDHEAYKEVKKEKPPFMSNNESENTELDAEIPETLQCMLCRDLLQDAVLIHCCGSSYCDECIRTNLLESEQHECPTCHAIGISPDTLIPNRFLRTAVVKFKNETGYTKQKRSFSKQDSPNDSRNGASILESDTHDSSAVQKSEEKSLDLIENSTSPDEQITETKNNETMNSETPTIDEILVGSKKESDAIVLKENTDVSTKNEFLDDSVERIQGKTEKEVEEQEKRELTIDEQEEFTDSSANESMYSIANNRSIKQSMNIRNVIRPVTSVVPQSMQMHRAPILPHPPRGIFPRPGIPPDPRFYRTPMRDPHAYSMGMGPSPYGYGAPPLRPHGYPDPFAFMSHRHPHIHGAQFPRPHISGHPQNYSEPPPPVLAIVFLRDLGPVLRTIGRPMLVIIEKGILVRVLLVIVMIINIVDHHLIDTPVIAEVSQAHNHGGLPNVNVTIVEREDDMITGQVIKFMLILQNAAIATAFLVNLMSKTS
ncbi:E3 ubiquitin-protein ligase RBBP6-like protein [Leptotrombidium deliense]|uniref:E3 ubiquitin-protein ligase RBBP6-like protein n=1 Tax=Leptotrombidium deliense TaxID=299467 RepID=A0A443SBB3_9ACAR|nr:E3 ubiquitin-protein ligase RBBP6-like protein [Leptotrombidium deliense]